ncbi:MAG: MucB/RseB C-terminal domain-containing protein [Steroidobacteraceae bacterium]
MSSVATRCVTLICLFSSATVCAATVDARTWLERMSEALVNRNYDGRYIHSTDMQSETMRIVHRNVRGKVTERLISLDGMGREYIRTDTEVTYYMPDKRSVLVESRADSDGLLSLIPEYKPGLEAYYDISTGPVGKVLERKAQLVIVQPRDERRYGYRLWLDTETAMPLKSQLFDRQGRIIEQVAFAELSLRERIPDTDLQPKVDTAGYEWVRHEVRRRTVAQESIGWQVENLPPGFKLKVARLQPVVGSAAPVKHLVFSDGLATVSVFIAQVSSKTQMNSGFQKVGSTYAFHADSSGYQVTAVGEVPAATLRDLVTSLTRQYPSPGSGYRDSAVASK